jgi:signal transduction histidine kinase
MRFGVKLALSLVVPLVVLTAALGYAFQRRSHALLREELAKEGRAIGLAVQIAAEDYLRDRQLDDLRQLVDRITGYERVLGLRVFDPHGDLRFQSSTLDSLPFTHLEELAIVLRDRQPTEIRRSVGREHAVGFLFPLTASGGQLLGAVQVLQLEAFIREDARANRDFIVALSLAMVVATMVIVFAVTRQGVTRPIEELVRSFRAVGAEDLPARVPVRSDDELGRLAQEFNGMCERLEAARHSLQAEQERRMGVESRLRSAERLAGIGRLAAGLAHEIGTPLNVISGRADALRRTLTGDARAERSLGIIATQIERIARIVRDMLDFARVKRPRRMPTDVTSVLRTVLELTEPRLQQQGVEIELGDAARLRPVMADADQLQQVFLNLVMNAVDAMPEGGRLRLATGLEWLTHPERNELPRWHVTVTFKDNGIGIEPEVRDRVFDPFFTTKEAGKGTGLGLSVSYGIIEEHDGWFDLDSEPGRGTRVRVCLPVAEQATDSPAHAAREISS